MILDIFALVVILLIVAMAITLVTYLGPLPGKIAQQRGNPQADAIRVLGWIGLITMGAGWLIALVWAYLRPISNQAPNLELEKRVALLEQKLLARETKGDQS